MIKYVTPHTIGCAGNEKAFITVLIMILSQSMPDNLLNLRIHHSRRNI
jgi:hypothetical protein